MSPPEKITPIKPDPMASGAIPPAPPMITEQPTVSTRKNVPMNSTMYLFIVCFAFVILKTQVGGYDSVFGSRLYPGTQAKIAHSAHGRVSLQRGKRAVETE